MIEKYFAGTLGLIRSSKGIAILIAMFATFVLAGLAIEVGYDSAVEYRATSRDVNRLRAYYAAKAGAEIGLLRVLIFQQAQEQFGEQLEDQREMLDLIWQLPFTWPPTVPDSTSSISSDQINKVVKTSMFNSQYLLTISSEGSKIDINMLGSDSAPLRQSTREQILKIFNDKLETDEKFSNKYRNFSFDDLTNHMVDWVDSDQESLVAGDESSFYRDLEGGDHLPPNQAFKTLEELRIVATMEADLFDLLKNRVTVYGVKGINVNYANQEVLKSIDPQLTDEVIVKIMERRNKPEEGPFKDLKDFNEFLEEELNDPGEFNSSNIPLLFGPEYNFRIISTGQFGDVTREIELVTYDKSTILENLIATLDKQDEENSSNETDEERAKREEAEQIARENETDEQREAREKKEAEDAKKAEETKPKKKSKGRPTIVYWRER